MGQQEDQDFQQILNEIRKEVTALREVTLVCNQNCHQCERLLSAIESAIEIKRALAGYATIEEQTITVLRRLTDRFRDRDEALGRAIDKLESLSEQVHLMAKNFEILEGRLDDAINCPMNPKEKKAE